MDVKLFDFLPWFSVTAFVLFDVSVATLITKLTASRSPEVTFVPIDWATSLYRPVTHDILSCDR